MTALCTAALISLCAATANAQYADLTPPSGSVDQTGNPVWASRGYLFTVQQTVSITGLQWWIVLPSGVSISARIYNGAGTLVASGTPVFGNGTEQWYQSAVNFTFQAGQTYTAGFYHSAASQGTFDRKDNFTQGFSVLPQFTNVNGRSNCANYQDDIFPNCTNSWGPYIRLVTGPIEICGNGTIAGNEACDDGNMVDSDGCSALCQVEHGFTCMGLPSVCMSSCGDSLIASDEGCDDGNSASLDGCSATCAVENGYGCTGEPSVCSSSCGDGVIAAGDRDCDDGNTVDGDGCSASCAIEAGWSCSGEPSVCLTVCGDGMIGGDEACDDGNTMSLDGCTDTCFIETGWTCSDEPSVCYEVCGDGITTGGEACDDGNKLNDDGCDSMCNLEGAGVGGSGGGGSSGSGFGTVDDDDGSTKVGGCGCRTAGHQSSRHGLAALALLGLALWRRRRRR